MGRLKKRIYNQNQLPKQSPEKQSSKANQANTVEGNEKLNRMTEEKDVSTTNGGSATNGEGGASNGHNESVVSNGGGGGHDDSVNGEHDPYYPPIVSLPEVKVPTGEDGEEEIFKIRSKLYRWDPAADPPEWKERGTGYVRILKHSEKGHFRILMRRDKTLKVCANHFVRPWMILQPMKGSNDKAWMYQVHADFADEEAKAEVFAIRFGTPENASKFKTAFDKAVIESIENEALVIGHESGDGEEEGEESSKSNEAKKDGDVEPKKRRRSSGSEQQRGRQRSIKRPGET